MDWLPTPAISTVLLHGLPALEAEAPTSYLPAAITFSIRHQHAQNIHVNHRSAFDYASGFAEDCQLPDASPTVPSTVAATAVNYVQPPVATTTTAAHISSHAVSTHAPIAPKESSTQPAAAAAAAAAAASSAQLPAAIIPAQQQQKKKANGYKIKIKREKSTVPKVDVKKEPLAGIMRQLDAPSAAAAAVAPVQPLKKLKTETAKPDMKPAEIKPTPRTEYRSSRDGMLKVEPSLAKVLKQCRTLGNSCSSSSAGSQQQQHHNAVAADDVGKPGSGNTSSNRYSADKFWDFYVKSKVLYPEATHTMRLNLAAVLAGMHLKLNGRDRKLSSNSKPGPLHMLRKICRALRGSLGPQAEYAWRNIGLKDRDSQGDLNLRGCYAFLESILPGSCPYSKAEKAQAATWIAERATSPEDFDYLWPQEEELNDAGVVCYLARLMSWALGREAPVKPTELNSCFKKGGNGYKALDNELKAICAYMWNWSLPLSLRDIQASEAEPARVKPPPNRAPKGSRMAASKGKSKGKGKGNKSEQAGIKRKAAAIDSDDEDYQYPAAAGAKGRRKGKGNQSEAKQSGRKCKAVEDAADDAEFSSQATAPAAAVVTASSRGRQIKRSKTMDC